MVDGKGPYEYHDDRPWAEKGYAPCTLPTQIPSVSPSDMLESSDKIPTRAQRHAVQNLNPRLDAGDGDYKNFPDYADTHSDGKGKS